MSSTIDVKIRPWLVYVKAYEWTKLKHKKKFLPRFRKYKSRVQKLVSKEAEFTLPFVPERHRAAILARSVEKLLTEAGLDHFQSRPILLNPSGAVMVSDDTYGQAMIVKINPNGEVITKTVERKLVMPEVKRKRKSKSTEGASLSKGREAHAARRAGKKSKKASKEGGAKKKERAPRTTVAGKYDRDELIGNIETLLAKTSAKSGFTRDDLSDALALLPEYKGADGPTMRKLRRVMVKHIWDLKDSGKIDKLDRRHYAFKGAKGKDLPGKKSKKKASSTTTGKKKKKRTPDVDAPAPEGTARKVRRKSAGDGSPRRKKKVRRVAKAEE